MFKLEDIVVGARLSGVVSGESVEVLSAKWGGSNVLTVVYKSDSGQLNERLFYRDEESSPTIQLVDKSRLWSFDGDGAIMRLVLEANRINLAWFFDPYLAVHSSEITPLPHQISAVYEEMLPRLPLRYILADDPGAGKTIMAGLLIKEQIARGDLRRCLIVTPGSLAEQWQDELLQKFSLNFTIITNELLESAASGNAFDENNLCVARLDKLARNEDVKNKLLATDWDLIICDEAHKMSATVFGGEVKETKRFKLGRELSKITRNFLLLTATPHNGKNEDFQLFLSLIDQDRFEGRTPTSNQSSEINDVMRRLVKEDLLTFEGKPLFPERKAYVVNYKLSEKEAKLYQEVTNYVREEFNRADNLLNDKRKSNVGFALTSLQRRLASSPEAIYNSLRRRRNRLERILKDVQVKLRAEKPSFSDEFVEFDEDELTGVEIEQIEDSAVEGVSAAQTEAELETEIATVERLEKLADETRRSGEDRKWRELSNLLQDKTGGMYDADGLREKLIIFTEHKDTLDYLVNKIGVLLGNPGAVVSIYGGTTRDQRRKIEEEFKQNPDVKILVATDAAGEGVNLQRAHLMINYDLPWNPNRLEQRFGRIHRIGQKEVCHLWNLVANETREGDVFQRLFDKIEQERKALGGRVFDVLGKLFDDAPLRDLIVQAIRYGDSEEARSKMEETLNLTFDPEKLRRLLLENALTDDVADVEQIMRVREEMERAEARKLQPYFIESFFRNAFETLGGVIAKREQGRFAVLKTPFEIRNRGGREPISTKYERVCFDKKFCDLPGKPKAQLIAPGTAILDATSDVIGEKFSNVLKQGTTFVDETDPGETPRLLFYVETSIQDGVQTELGTQRVISRNVSFIEIREDGTAIDAGAAPYLDYRPLRDEEKEPARAFVETQDWLTQDLEARVQAFVADKIASKLFAQFKEKRLKQVEKIRKAVRSRLTEEIQVWDSKYGKFRDAAEENKPNAKQNAERAKRQVDELVNRLHARDAELDKMSEVSARAPLIRGGALILPRGLIDRLTGAAQETPSTFAHETREIERIAVDAVLKIERSLGYEPRDVGAENRGYDVESTIPPEKRDENGAILRFIEVKGRRAGATTVTVTKNEILTALNKPEEFILALVEVDGANVKTTYLRKPFNTEPDFNAASVNYDVAKLKKESEIAFES